MAFKIGEAELFSCGRGQRCSGPGFSFIDIDILTLRPVRPLSDSAEVKGMANNPVCTDNTRALALSVVIYAI